MGWAERYISLIYIGAWLGAAVVVALIAGAFLRRTRTGSSAPLRTYRNRSIFRGLNNRPTAATLETMHRQPSGPPPVRDVSASRWLMERLWAWHHERHPPVLVGSFVPTGFTAYARIFHPVWVNRENAQVTWAELAARQGRELHPEIAFWEVLRPTGAGPDWSINEVDAHPSDGDLPEELCARLAQILERFTSTPDRCWFAVWEGWGNLPDELQKLPKAEAPFGRRYLLFAGRVTEITQLRWAPPFFQSPSLWWPDDRAWCVSTEIDDYSTFVAGSEASIEAVVNDPVLEALPTRIGARGDFGDAPPRDHN